MFIKRSEGKIVSIVDDLTEEQKKEVVLTSQAIQEEMGKKVTSSSPENAKPQEDK